MRVAVLSDIHGNLPALEAVIDEAGRERVDLVVNLGDIVSGPLWPRETAERLMRLGWPTIAGNHERQALALDRRRGFGDRFAYDSATPEQRAWLAALPKALELDGGAIRLVALEQELTLTGAFVDATTAVIADRMIVLAVASRTTQAITGATSYGVGVAGNTSQFGGSLGIALGSNNIGVIGPTAFYTSTPIRITAAGGNFTGGKVRVVLYALAFTAPSS